MSDDEKKFEKWYLSWKGKKYIFKDQLFYYCQMDVEILRKACVKYSQLIRASTSNAVYPFYNVRCMTIASLAMHIFRTCFLQKKINRGITLIRLSFVNQSKHCCSELVGENV